MLSTEIQKINDCAYLTNYSRDVFVAGSHKDINKILENQREDNNTDREMYRDTIDKFDSKLDKFAIALEGNNSRLEIIECDIKKVKERVGI